jgi:hypothetical protein
MFKKGSEENKKKVIVSVREKVNYNFLFMRIKK